MATSFQFVYQVRDEVAVVRVYAHQDGTGPLIGSLTMPRRQWWELAQLLGAGTSATPAGPRADFVRLESPKAEAANG
jgi:hypothetical protein